MSIKNINKNLKPFINTSVVVCCNNNEAQKWAVGTVCPFASNISIFYIQYFILIFVLQSFQESISFKFKIKFVTIFLYDFFKIFYKGVDFNIRFMLQYGYEAIKRLVAEMGKFFYVTYFITLN